MGDKFRSDIPKPVNNPLLSGAGHGFPFDTFQGSSLLVPVTQENSSILSDQAIGEPDKFVGQDVPTGETTLRLEDAHQTDMKNAQSSSSQPVSNNSSYVRLFTSFFGGAGQSKPDPSQGDQIRGNEQHQMPESVSSTPRSFSPYCQVPNFQTVTPALQVPSVTPTSTVVPSESADPYPSNRTLPPPLFQQQPSHVPGDALSRSGDGLLKNPQQIPIGFGTDSGSNIMTMSSYGGTGIAMKPISEQSVPINPQANTTDYGRPPYPLLTTPGAYPQPINPPPNQIQSLSGEPAPPMQPPNPNSQTGHNIPLVEPNMFHSETSMSKPPSTSQTAPPLFSGDSKTYRLSHNRRPVYAPIPGLTLSTPATASFIPSSNAPPPALQQRPPVFPNPSSVPPISSSINPPPSSVSPAGPTSTPAVASYFSTSSASMPTPSIPQPVLQTIRPPVTTAQLPFPSTSLPYPASQDPQQQSLFSPISKASPDPPKVAPPVFNPVAVHPNITATNIPTVFAPPPMSSLPIKPTSSPVTPSTNSTSLSSSVPPTSGAPPFAGAPGSKEKTPSPTVVPPFFHHLAQTGRLGSYRPVTFHWFFKKECDSKEIWYPFSRSDSNALETAYQSDKVADENFVIPTDGGRYDVSIINRSRSPVYWKENPKEVRRCSWFYKNPGESRYRPYDENTAFHLEEEYRKCLTTGSWRKKIDLKHGDYIIMYSANSIAHFEKNFCMPDGWEDVPDGSQHMPPPAKIVKRGVSDDFDIDEGESQKVDHLMFVVHGIGSVCDLKARTIEEAVDVFRTLSHQLIKSHFNNSVNQGLVHRVEILPVSWHSNLHGETTGLDKKLESITLKSIPRLRYFTNDTLLDILFYTSPIYCQNIVQQVGHEMSILFEKFKSRNPTFNGEVSLVGHSLGSLILFDMLCHQKPPSSLPEHLSSTQAEGPVENKIGAKLTRRHSGFVVGNAGTGQPCIEYPQLAFQPVAFFALGSPIGMFVTVRGIDSLGLDFKLPTCPRFFNIFHPFDPVAYRMEALINPELAEKRPVLIPHHKGRKRMHLELKETISRVGADLKQRLVDSIRSTWNTVYQLTAFGRADDGLEQEVDRVIEKQIERQRSESVASCLNESDSVDFDVGLVNMGRRVDYVLQEAPLESFNEYVSAIRSHLVYWDSEDTVLMVLKEVYNAVGISPDNESMISQDVSSSNSPPSPPSPSLPSVGWNINDEPKAIPGPEGQPPLYGFVNNQ